MIPLGKFDTAFKTFMLWLSENDGEVVKVHVPPMYKHGYVVFLYHHELYSLPYLCRDLNGDDRVRGTTVRALWDSPLWSTAGWTDERTWRNKVIDESVSAVNHEVMYIAKCRYKLMHGNINDEATLKRHREHIQHREGLLIGLRTHHNNIIDHHLGKIVELNYRTGYEVAA